MGIVKWLGAGLSPNDVGLRACLFARLAAAGIPVPHGFLLGRSSFDVFSALARSRAPREFLTALPDPVCNAITEALARLGGPVAVRPSVLDAEPAEGERPAPKRPPTHRDGRPERETFLNLQEAAEVMEAVRRIWTHSVVAAPTRLTAVLVQRFVAADACAVVRPDRSRPEELLVEATFGTGDLLSSGLVVPDRLTVDARTARLISRRLGRKAQMSVPRSSGGTRRIPVVPALARTGAFPDEALGPLVTLFGAVSAAAGSPVAALTVALAGGELHVTGVRQGG